MPAFSFNAQGIDPQYGAGGSQLPLGKHPVIIAKSELKPTQDGQGGFMALTLQAIDGPAKGIEHIDRLNLHNKNPETVRIANQQLSAYCHVIGVFAFQSTEELHGKPFVVDIQADAKNPQYTRVAGLYDMNGNEPGKAGGGAPQTFGAPATGQPAPGAQPAPGEQPAWGGGAAPATTGGAWAQGGGGQPATGQPGWGQR